MLLSRNSNLSTRADANHEKFKQETIPGAKYIKLADLTEPNAEVPQTLPSHEVFMDFVKRNSIKKTDQLIFFEQNAILAAARPWFIFKEFGHPNSFLLEGTLQSWKSQGYPTSTNNNNNMPPNESGDYSYNFNNNSLIDFENIMKLLKERSNKWQFVDSRAPGDFTGQNEMRFKGVRKGHIPGATNVFFKDLFDQQNNLKSKEELRTLFKAQGVDIDKPIVSYCMRGITACINLAALEYLGVDLDKNTKLYDGSWSEFGLREESKNYTGI